MGGEGEFVKKVREVKRGSKGEEKVVLGKRRVGEGWGTFWLLNFSGRSRRKGTGYEKWHSSVQCQRRSGSRGY